ncbi:MAG TPA: response regulator [Candidatus Paceibacterota bacterium]
MNVLLIAGDESVSKLLAPHLDPTYTVRKASTKNEIEEQLLASDICILDPDHVPTELGVGLLEHLRRNKCMLPFIIVTKSSSWSDKVQGFEAGADDYLTKPFHERELLARMEAIVRRTKR